MTSTQHEHTRQTEQSDGRAVQTFKVEGNDGFSDGDLHVVVVVEGMSFW